MADHSALPAPCPRCAHAHPGPCTDPRDVALREAWHILHDLRNAVSLWDGLGAALDRADRWCADNVPGEVEVAGGEG